MKITVNGDVREVEEGLPLVELLRILDIRAEQVAVERNLDVVPRREFATVRLVDGDALEIVTLVGGG